MTSGNDDQLQAVLTVIFGDHLLEGLSANESAATLFCLEQEEVALTLVHIEELGAQLSLIIEKTVTAEVDTKGLLSENLVQSVCRALTLRHPERNFGFTDAIFDF